MTAHIRLVTELEMLKIGAGAFSRAVASLGMMQGLEVGTQARGDLADILSVPVDPALGNSLIRPLESLVPELVSLGLPVTLAAAERLKKNILEGELNHQDFFYLCETIQSRLFDELGTRYLFSLDDVEAAEFASDDFGDEVHAKFPSVLFELDEASKCMALGRYTAAVFHWMRAVEVALRSVRLCLGATAPPAAHGRSWGAILGELRNMRTGSPPKWPDNDYFSGLYALIEAVMHAWRNGTMHIENKYTREEAKAIRECVRALMKKVASRMDEQGLPLA